MTTDIAVLERAVIVMAVCMAIQTLLFVASAVAGFIAWRRASEALVAARSAAEAQVVELRGHLERITAPRPSTRRSRMCVTQWAR
jgi:hypothetical protein